MSEEALQIAEKRSERERYIQLHASFQRITSGDEKAFLSELCDEIEENNRMGNTRALFKKTGDMKGTCHTNMGTIKDRNGKNLTEAE